MALINAGANIWVTDSVTGRTPVHSAAYSGYESCLRLLLDNSPDESIVNATDHQGRSVPPHPVFCSLSTVGTRYTCFAVICMQDATDVECTERSR